MENKEITDQIVAFIQSIGIGIHERSLDEPTFLPGIGILNGELIIDREKLTYPGDILHEAGHLALLTPEDRQKISGNVEPDENKSNSLEMGVICWTWAALLYLRLEPQVVFHKGGYRGASNYYIQMYATGQYIGLPLLQWMELCKHQYDQSDLAPFPHMVKWLRS